MSMDETPDNITHTPPSLSEPQTQKPESKSGSLLSFGRIVAITVCASVLASLTTITYQHLYPTTQSPAPVITPQNSSNPPWQTIQAQIQELRQSQRALNEQSATNQQQIQHLMQEQPSQTQDWGLEKARYYLELALINAQWSHNIASTTHLLQTADHILAQGNYPNLATIRHAIAQDLAELAEIPTINTTEILDKINNIRQQVEQLNIHPVAVRTDNPTRQATEPKTWQDNVYDNMQQLRGLINIEHHDEGWLPPRPNTIALLRDNIRMNLQQAQIGLIEQHQALFTSALQAASDSISASFDPNDPKTHALIQALQALKTTKVAYSFPPLHPYAQLFEQNEPNSEPASSTKVSS